MKKNISINISGIIFHIEEDAYERLRDYLDSINKYFSTFDDSLEIIADIESRIAEIFLAKLNENKQIINQEDVEDLVTTMGSIKDFQAVEEPLGSEESHQESDESWKDTSSRKLYRDEKHKLLGGVCAGIAHYFKIDPLWIRLIFIVIFFGSYGTAALVYIIMWIVVPANLDLKEDKKLKKIYRNPDGKVLGGVSSGIATYFGVDVVVVRLLFVLLIFLGGTGLITYIILWIILPEARSITDKVQMQGEPVTLSNIESNIKKSLKVKDGEEENIFIKILLFPFRLIAAIISGLGKALGPVMLFLVHFIRVAVGLFMIFVSLVLTFCIVVVVGIVLGLISTSMWDVTYLSLGEMGLPLELMADTFPIFTSVAAFFMLLIPCIVGMLLGASLIAKRIIFNATTGWSLFALFIISGIIVSANIPAIAYKFREDGEHRVTESFDLGNKTAILTMKEIGMEDYSVTKLRLRGHEGPEYKLVQDFESQGSSRKNAIENAQMISYGVSLEDSVFTFDSNIEFKDNAVFRAQRLDMTLYIPYNKPFRMSANLEHIIYNTIHRAGYRVWDMPNNVWMITQEGLMCLSCKNDNDNDDWLEGYNRKFEFKDFSDIDINSAFTVRIEKSDEFKVLVKGADYDIDNISINQDGDKLNIDFDKRMIRDREAIKIKVKMPQLNALELTGAAKVYLNDFDQRELRVKLNGASFLKANVDVGDLKLDLTGASEMQLSGDGKELTAEITGASHLDAYNFEVRSAKVEAHGASSARVFVTDELFIEERLASTVKYKGNPRVNR